MAPGASTPAIKGTIYVADPNGGNVTAIPGGSMGAGNTPHDVAVDGSGNVWATLCVGGVSEALKLLSPGIKGDSTIVVPEVGS